MNKVRKKIPVRTCKKTYSGEFGYRRYKPYLQKDFNSRCGYCDEYDVWSNGKRGFHIDHFAPKKEKLFPHLKNEYSNLVYSCFFCNNSKSDTWVSKKADIPVVGDKGFIDPCTKEYESHFCRNDKGEILFKSNLGEYIYKELKFGLPRRSILWKIDELDELIMRVQEALGKKKKDTKLFNRLKVRHHQLLEEFHKYFKLHKETIDDN